MVRPAANRPPGKKLNLSRRKTDRFLGRRVRLKTLGFVKELERYGHAGDDLALKVRIGVLGRILSNVDHGSMVFRTVRGYIGITYKAAQSIVQCTWMISLCGEIDPMILPKGI